MKWQDLVGLADPGWIAEDAQLRLVRHVPELYGNRVFRCGSIQLGGVVERQELGDHVDAEAGC